MNVWKRALCRALIAIVAMMTLAFTVGACGTSLTPQAPAPAVLADPTSVVPAATDGPEPTATMVATATPTPIPTATPWPTVDAVTVGAAAAGRAGLADFFTLPMNCALRGTADSVETLWQCNESDGDRSVSAVAAGRVVMVVRSAEGAVADPPAMHTPWAWDRGLSLGSFIVVDHGSMGDWGNVMTLYGGLDTIDAELGLGSVVSSGDIIASARLDAPLQYEIWTDGWPHGVEQLEAPSREATPMDLAPLLARVSVPPADAECGFPLGDASSLPNTARPYRHGVHRGVDFVCGAQGHDALAFADGTVAMVVRDYADATTAGREALLVSPEQLGGTPHWTLTMLFGNFVVVDHGSIPDVGRTYSIYAHLEQVDPAIQLGRPVTVTQRIGEIGDRGTSQSAAGTTAADPSRVHLHWELFVEHEYFGTGLTTADTELTYRSLLCDDAILLNGCL